MVGSRYYYVKMRGSQEGTDFAGQMRKRRSDAERLHYGAIVGCRKFRTRGRGVSERWAPETGQKATRQQVGRGHGLGVRW